jgi:hypothetical protein
MFALSAPCDLLSDLELSFVQEQMRLSGRVASILYRVGQLYRTVMIASLGGDFGPP